MPHGTRDLNNCVLWLYSFFSCQQIWRASATDKHDLRAPAAAEAAPAIVPSAVTLRGGLATAVRSACCQTAHREVGHFTAQCGEAGMETVLAISSVGYRRQGWILLSEISDSYTQDNADDLLNLWNIHKQCVEHVANAFFHLFPVCTCFFCKVRSGLIRPIVKQGECGGHSLGPMDLYRCPAGAKSSLW